MRMLLGGRSRIAGSSVMGGVALVIIVVCGLGLMVMGGWNLVRAGMQRGWETVPCEITYSEIQETFDTKGNRRFEVLLRYSYEHKGQIRQGDRIGAGLRFLGNARGTTSWKAAEEDLRRYAKGIKTQCYVNPKNPSEAALRLAPFTPGIVCIVAPVGLAFLFGVRIPLRKRKKQAGLEPVSPVPNPQLREARQLAFWSSLLVVMGGFCTYFLFVDPFLKSREAKSWPAVPCEILESRIRETSTRRGADYEPDVLYEFEYNGKKHRSNQTHFDSAGPERLAATTRFLANFPAGTKAVCYVNPQNLKESVLERSMPLFGSFYPLIGFCMFGGGLAGVGWGLWTMFGKPKAALKPVKEAATRWGAAPNPNPVNLRPLTASTALLLASIVGLTAAGGVIAWRVLNFLRNWRELGVIQFSLIEILILIFTAIGAGYLALRCWRYFDPHPNLTLERGAVALGDAFELDWKFTGPVSRLRSLKIFLQGREETMVPEEVRGQYGTKHTSEKKEQETFYEETLLATQSQTEGARGRVCVKLPRDTMPTFTGEKSKVIWSLRFEGDIAWSPAMKHDFPINVLPESANA